MVCFFWSKRKLLKKDNRGVIKLIPKEGNRFLFTSWRPITLLTTTYKIIAWIIAQRLKHMLPDIINCQQTGFIARRNIVENVLSLHLTQEWALITDQDVLFVKFDFQKAYDRVSHTYLWETLTALGLDLENVERIQGLVMNASASIHVNGKLTEEFPIQRGVRQGCPLAPLLFAMSTQPMMRVLREEERASRLKGAKLNLTKSLIMPLAPRVLPDWVRSTGCKIATPGTHFKYLGVVTSSPIDENAIAQAVVKKIRTRLSHWSNRLISWPAKTLLSC
ncbi:hypothetical protein R1sor_013609 [Riccia sorocarpa]|uniref:Reverse transcriptase domain-containing protein n=1 Tax=Riccia sorocarpa TaxID=122646 RepID=A0ABD3H727_9MARC